MVKHGEPPYIECSGIGNKRLSAFWAKVNGKTIEEQYQSAKLVNGKPLVNWREAKGQKADNQEEVAKLYSQLWDQYIAEHPDLLALIKSASGLSDQFGRPGGVCQATELWRIRNAK